jgi:hypothetical protein
VACPGEYESASFVVRSRKEPISGLTATASDLKGEKGVIPASSLNLTVVKCWYVGGKDDTLYRHVRLLTPELLVKDDGLVKVDTEKKHNYLKLTFQKDTPNPEEKYICISEEKEWENLPEVLPMPVEEFPVYDSKTLQPVNIDPEQNKQFWITLQVPKTAVPGVYRGKIVLRTSQGTVGELNIRVKVLPFTLSNPYPISSILYKGELGPVGCKGVLHTSGPKNEQQYRAEMEDMVAHGVTNPSIFFWWYDHFDKENLRRILEIRNALGMKDQPLYNFGERLFEVQNKPEKIGELKTKIKDYIDLCKSQGVTDVYVYGEDEAMGDVLRRQRPIWQAIHEMGGKVFVAGWLENIKEMGDLQDMQIMNGRPSKEEAAEWHAKNHQITIYANPQAGVEQPLRYRRDFGLALWQNDYDGAMNHAYMISYRDIWNDFDSGCRQENMAYPTADGVVDTTEWEGYREGVDDVRYLMTLLDTVKSAKDTKDPKMKDKVAAAEQYVSDLKTTNLQGRNLDTVRMEIIFHILGLKEGKQ